jgi:hypothetical protein
VKDYLETFNKRHAEVGRIFGDMPDTEPSKASKAPFVGFEGSVPGESSKIKCGNLSALSDENPEMHESTWVTRCYYCGQPLESGQGCVICAQPMPF